MTVLNGARRDHKPLLHSALGVFVPKPRVTEQKPGGSRAGWLRRHASRIKDTLVAVVVCGLPTAAAWEWHGWAGLIATAAAVMVVDAVADPGVSPDEHAG